MWKMLAFLLLFPFGTAAQESSGWHYRQQVNFGCQVLLSTLFNKQKMPGVKAYVGFSAQASKGIFILNYGPSISVYTKTIGANLNPLINDVQIDFINSFSGGVAGGQHLDYQKYMRTMHNADYYNLVIDRKVAAVLSTNFVLNNHRRHQTVGSMNFTADNVSFYYYNDGGPIFDRILPLSDNFDRYWSGGGGITVHSKKGFNYVEFGFDQFTGYKPLLYELSNLLGIRVPLYDKALGTNLKGKSIPNYNTSAYYLKVKLDAHFGWDIGVLGSLVDKKGRHWSIQDQLHMKFHDSFHPNNDNTRFYIGGSYNNIQNVSF